MENKPIPEIIQKLLPIYKAVATPTYKGCEDNHKIDISNGPGEGRWERNASGNEGVLVLDEYRRNGRDFEPRFSYEIEKHGIRCDHSDTSFLMVLSSARNKFAEVTGMTFRDWLEANGQPVEHLHENTAQELKVSRNYKTDTAEDIAAREERRIAAEAKGAFKGTQSNWLDDEKIPEKKTKRKSRQSKEKEVKVRMKAPDIKAIMDKSAEPETSTKPAPADPPRQFQPAEQLNLLI